MRFCYNKQSKISERVIESENKTDGGLAVVAAVIAIFLDGAEPSGQLCCFR
jgi:hypothetical protein